MLNILERLELMLFRIEEKFNSEFKDLNITLGMLERAMERLYVKQEEINNEINRIKDNLSSQKCSNRLR